MAASAPRFSKPPAIRQSPDDPTRLFLECQVQATPKPDASWFQDNTPLSSSSTRQKQSVKASAGNIYDIGLEISDVGANDSGTYRVVVKNPAGEVTANLSLNFSAPDDAEPAPNKSVASLIDDETNLLLPSSADGIAPIFIQKPVIKQEQDGKRLIFECKISADPKPELIWTHDEKPLQDPGRFLVSCDSLPNNIYVASLQIDNVISSDGGKYKVTAKNRLGESNAHIGLNLDSKLPVLSG